MFMELLEDEVQQQRLHGKQHYVGICVFYNKFTIKSLLHNIIIIQMCDKETK